MKIKRTIGLFSDLHVGSNVALFPRKFKLHSGVIIELTKEQEQLNEYWEDMTKQFKDCDTIMMVGDSLEGLNKKEFGHGLLVSSLNEQVKACISLLKPMIGNKQFLVFTGSGYHGSADYKCDESIANAFPNGEFCGAMQNIILDKTGFKINVAHGEGGSAIYRATKLDRELMFFKLAESCQKLDSPNLIVRGHLHYYTYLENEHMRALQLPCWKAFEVSKIFLKNIGRMQPDIGGCKLIVFDDNSVMIKPYLYKLPHISDKYKSF